MPYFSWTGVDITGKIYRGKRCARNKETLAATLLDSQVALLTARELRSSFLRTRLSYKQLSYINSQLGLLLEAGVRLNQSLELMSDISYHKIISPMLSECARSVREGESLHKSLEVYTPLMHPLMISVLAAAERSGNLSQACRMLTTHYQEQGAFAEQMRNALLLPMITIFFFLISSFGIFMYVIPRFEHLFVVINKNPGKLTQTLFYLSNFLRSGSFLVWFLVLAGFAISVLVVVWRKKRTSCLLDSLLIKIPLMSSLTIYYNITLFLQALGLLVQNGVPLVSALATAKEVLINKVLKKKIDSIIEQVESGVSFSHACNAYSNIFFKHAQALFAIGEASGSLGRMIQKAADIYRTELNGLLSKWVKCIPIVCLLLLGMLIALLVIAIYAPLLTLSHAIN